MDQDINQETKKFRETVCRTLKGKTRQDTQLRFCSVVAVPALLFSSESRTVTSRDESILQTAEVHFLSAAEGCTRQDGLKNEDIRKEQSGVNAKV
jgi:hypothetical protein